MSYVITAVVFLLIGFAGGYAVCLNRAKMKAKAKAELLSHL